MGSRSAHGTYTQSNIHTQNKHIQKGNKSGGRVGSVGVCVCACARACVRACVRECVRARVRAKARGHNVSLYCSLPYFLRQITELRAQQLARLAGV